MADLDKYPTSAIVVGCRQTGLGMLRSLALAGIPAYAACPTHDLLTLSRWYRPTPGPAPWDGALGPQGYESLRAMPLASAVLIPGADDAALWLADMPKSDLCERFRVSSSSRETLEILQDKSRFLQFLATTDIPHPRTFPIRSGADIDAIPFDELDRVFIKPTNSQLFSDVVGRKGIWVRNREEFKETWQKLDGLGFRLMAQEYVPGGSADHYFIDGFRDRNGIMAGLFARRRLRIYPADFGNSCYCKSIPLADVSAALENLTTLLSRLNYRGIFSAEFKRDSRDGKFRILEVNTRAWTYVEFAARCGVNVCQMASEDASDRPVTVAPRSYPTGAGCLNFSADIKSVLSQSPASRSPWPEIMGQWARAHFHIFRWDDPRPGLSIAWQMVRELVRKKTRRLVHRR